MLGNIDINAGTFWYQINDHKICLVDAQTDLKSLSNILHLFVLCSSLLDRFAMKTCLKISPNGFDNAMSLKTIKVYIETRCKLAKYPCIPIIHYRSALFLVC
jgi:hypothetical protein